MGIYVEAQVSDRRCKRASSREYPGAEYTRNLEMEDAFSVGVFELIGHLSDSMYKYTSIFIPYSLFSSHRHSFHSPLFVAAPFFIQFRDLISTKMYSFLPSLLLAALASTASGLPSFHGPLNFKRDSPNSIPFPTGTDIPTFADNNFAATRTSHRGAFGTGSAHGTGSHSGDHHHHTGIGDHHSVSPTLADRQLSESGIPFSGSFPTSFPMPTGTGGFPFSSGTGGFGGGFPTGGLVPHPEGVAHASGHHPGVFGTGFSGSPTGCGGHTGSQSGGFASPTGVGNFKQNFPSGVAGASGGFPSMSLPSGSGFGGGAPTGGFGMGGGSASPSGGSGQGGHGQHSHGSGSATGGVHNSKRQMPSGSGGPSGGFPSTSIPTGTGFGGGAPTGGFGGGSASPTGGFGGQHGQQHAQGTGISGFGGGFPLGTGFPSGPSGGFPFPTGGFPSGPSGGFPNPTGSGTGALFPFPTTFQTSVIAPSSAA